MPSLAFLVPQEEVQNIRQYDGKKELNYVGRHWRVSTVKLAQGDMHQAYTCVTEDCLAAVLLRLSMVGITPAVFESE
jgi:hypothetical protein